MKASGGSNKRIFYIALVAALLIVIGVLVFLLLRPGGERAVAGKSRDPNANVGQYEGKTQEEIIEELNKIVEDGMFNISINSDIVFERGDGEGDLRIENIAANRLLMSVQITLDETGEMIYETDIIEPGYYIQTDRLDVILKKGVYPATALFTAYDPDTEEVVGQAGAKVTITVKN